MCQKCTMAQIVQIGQKFSQCPKGSKRPTIIPRNVSKCHTEKRQPEHPELCGGVSRIVPKSQNWPKIIQKYTKLSSNCPKVYSKGSQKCPTEFPKNILKKLSNTLKNSAKNSQFFPQTIASPLYRANLAIPPRDHCAPRSWSHPERRNSGWGISENFENF